MGQPAHPSRPATDCDLQLNQTGARRGDCGPGQHTRAPTRPAVAAAPVGGIDSTRRGLGVSVCLWRPRWRRPSPIALDRGIRALCTYTPAPYLPPNPITPTPHQPQGSPQGGGSSFLLVGPFPSPTPTRDRTKHGSGGGKQTPLPSFQQPGSPPSRRVNRISRHSEVSTRVSLCVFVCVLAGTKRTGVHLESMYTARLCKTGQRTPFWSSSPQASRSPQGIDPSSSSSEGLNRHISPPHPRSQPATPAV